MAPAPVSAAPEAPPRPVASTADTDRGKPEVELAASPPERERLSPPAERSNAPVEPAAPKPEAKVAAVKPSFDPAVLRARSAAKSKAKTQADTKAAEPPAEAKPASVLASKPNLPEVAAAPPKGEELRVAVDTARVRSEPSGKAATRGLLPRGTRLVAVARKDDWIRVQAPKGFADPSWVHGSLLK